MNDYIEKLIHVNNNFKDLEFFKGRFLRHIYEHKREIEHRQAEETREVVQEVKNKPPENNQLEMRKIKQERIAKMKKKTKPFDLHIFGLD